MWLLDGLFDSRRKWRPNEFGTALFLKLKRESTLVAIPGAVTAAAVAIAADVFVVFV